MSADEIKSRNYQAVPKKTRQSNDWAMGVWREWAKYRNAQPATVLEPGFPIPENVALLSNELLDYWGQRFILEVRRKDGKVYPPNTLVQITSAIQRYLRTECGRPDVSLMKSDCVEFSGYRTALDTRMKELHADGVGVTVNSSEPVLKKEELKFWDTGVFNLETSEGLSNAVFFYNGKLFGFRGHQEHIDAKAEQFLISVNLENGVRYVKYTPHSRKNSQGGLKNRRVNRDPIVHYEQNDRDTSLVELYVKYLSLIPSVGTLYKKPMPGRDENNNPKFSSGNIPQSMIKSMVKRFYDEAGIDTEGRKITNHSARVTMCTALYNDKFSDKAVMSRSKHSSNAVHQYQREQFSILNDISNCLEPFEKKPALDVKIPVETVTSTVTKAEDGIDTDQSLFRSHPVADMDDTLTVHVPNCVKKMIIVKMDGKRMVIDV